MKKAATPIIDWLNLDDFDAADDFVFGVTQNDLDEIEEQIRMMEAPQN
jgi:hypothetical protein